MSERVTKHVLPVNFAQIRSAIPEIFHTQTKRSQTLPKQNLTQFIESGNYGPCRPYMLCIRM